MAQRGSDHIQRTLTSVLPRRRIGAMARRLGVVQRRRKLDVVALVYTLVLGFSTGNRRTLSGLRRGYFRATGYSFTTGSLKGKRLAALDSGAYFADTRFAFRPARQGEGNAVMLGVGRWRSSRTSGPWRPPQAAGARRPKVGPGPPQCPSQLFP